MKPNDVEKDYQSYTQLVTLWMSENPIKTNKLQVLLVVNGLLLTAVSVNGGFVAENWPIYLGGAVLSLVWVHSIGRTSLYQKIWQSKIRKLAERYQEDSRFHLLEHDQTELKAMKSSDKFLKVVGAVSSKYYLIGAPIVFCIGWFVVFLYFVLS